MTTGREVSRQQTLLAHDRGDYLVGRRLEHIAPGELHAHAGDAVSLHERNLRVVHRQPEQPDLLYPSTPNSLEVEVRDGHANLRGGHAQLERADAEVRRDFEHPHRHRSYIEPNPRYATPGESRASATGGFSIHNR